MNDVRAKSTSINNIFLPGENMSKTLMSKMVSVKPINTSRFCNDERQREGENNDANNTVDTQTHRENRISNSSYIFVPHKEYHHYYHIEKTETQQNQTKQILLNCIQPKQSHSHDICISDTL